ncbi:MAG: hypothetical protein Q8Q18_01885 [bacterium]|nr:hypothetical protein [bacterium]
MNYFAASCTLALLGEVSAVKSREESREKVVDFIPEPADIERFAQAARAKLQNLSFAVRRVIITNVVEKISLHRNF